MQRILFIIPLYDYMGESTTIAMPAFSMPYGMLSIDVYIKANVKDEIETDLLDLNIEAFRFITGECEYNDDSYLTDLVKDKAHNYQPDIVGISNLFNTSYDYLASISTVNLNDYNARSLDKRYSVKKGNMKK